MSVKQGKLNHRKPGLNSVSRRGQLRLDDFWVNKTYPLRLYERVTRIYNFIAALLGLLLLSPVLLVAALLVKLTSRGPIFYRSRRVGKDETVFTMYKLRTLKQGAEQKIGWRQVRGNSEHLTPVGGFLRKYKIDEIPQLINVLEGKMNLVGFRPLRPVLHEKCKQDVPGWEQRCLVKPGVTGLATLYGDHMTSPRNKARYDLLYIKHRSFGLDLKLVILTLVRVFFKLVSASALLAWALILLLLMPEQLRGVRIGVLKFHFSVIYFFPLALFLYILIARRMNTARLYLRRTVIDAPLAAFTFCSLVGLNNAADSFVALRGLAYYVCVGFAVYYLVVNLAVSEPFIHRATTFFLTVVCSLAGLAVIEYVVQMSTGIPDGLHRVALTLDIPLVLASYFVVAAPMTAARLQASKGSYSRCIWGAVLVLILVGCTLTFTRSAIFALVVALLIYVARQNKRMVPLVVLGGLLLLGTLSTLAPFRFDVATVATRFWQRTQGQLRLVLIVAKTNPECLLMGVGSRSLTVYLSHLGIAIGGPASKLSAGNSYIVWLMEEGVIGGFIMLCTVVLILRELWKAATRIANRRLSCLAWGVFSSLLGLLIMMWFCNLFTYLPTQMLFWGIAGLGVSIPHLFRTGAADYYRLIHVREALRP